MRKIGLFYGSSWGHTEMVAYLAQRALGEDLCDVYDVCRKPVDALGAYDRLIFGVPTTSESDMQDDWASFLPLLNGALQNKPLALFGLGDQADFSHAFVNGLGQLFDQVSLRGARVVGACSDDGYTYDKSSAYRQGRFVGLPIDVHSQPKLTEPRLRTWLAQVLLEMQRLPDVNEG